jgi:hypothetical protein
MRFFKKEGNIKHRKTDDKELAEEWMSLGFVEVDSNGNGISAKKQSSKKKKSE